MKFLNKIYFENKKLKKKLEKCEIDLKHQKEEYNNLFWNRHHFQAGCEHCVHYLSSINSDNLYGCDLWQKRHCIAFIRKDNPISPKDERAAQSASESNTPQDR